MQRARDGLAPAEDACLPVANGVATAAERMAYDRNRSRDGATRLGGVELAATVVLGAGALAGLVLWAKWGFAIAFDAIIKYCF